ncbi:MAG TPA: hypothetical protein VGG25_16395 [Streptosporangiaceae bacterium]|jgi:hypothetical protein
MGGEIVADEQARALDARPDRGKSGISGLRTIVGTPTAPPLTVAALCEEFGEVCESAVDPLEIASALEFEGVGDLAVRERYGYPDVFSLAREMYIQVPRQPAEPPPPADPWQVSRLQPLLHGLLYGLPAVCFPAAAALLAGPGAHVALIVALLASWATSQGLASLGYLRLGRTMDRGQAKRLLRYGMLAGLALVGVILAITAVTVQARAPVLIFGAGEAAYMLGACVLLVLGRERWLLVALAPGVAGSVLFLVLGRPPGLEHAAWAALAATPVLTLIAAWACTRPRGTVAGHLLVLGELRGAAPAAVFGLLAAGLLAFPVIAGAHGSGGVNTGALLATLPLSLSMGAAEWCLLGYRRRTRELLRSTQDLREFAWRSRLILAVAVGQYLLGAVVLTVIAAAVTVSTGLVHPDGLLLPELIVYLALGGAMFVALALQALGVRAVPVVACAAALGFELLWRELGLLSQLLACGGLLLVLGGYAVVVLSRAVRHAF